MQLEERNIINAEVCPDHVHMLVEIPSKYSVSSFMGFLKGKSSIMIYEKWGNMQYKYARQKFRFPLHLTAEVPVFPVRLRLFSA